MTEADVTTLRAIGKHWERQFGIMACSYGKEFTPHQWGVQDGAACSYWRDAAGRWRKQLLPDIAIWSAPGEDHEIKHKSVMNNGCYGYEEYRLRELVRFAGTTGRRVYMTIHDWARAGAARASEITPNRIEDWFCADIEALSRSNSGTFRAQSLVGGRYKDVPQIRWNRDRYFRPLADIWGNAHAISADSGRDA